MANDISVLIDALVEINEEEGQSPCQQKYVNSGNDKKILLLMCIGLTSDDNQPLFSFDDQPWSLQPKKLIKPNNNDFVQEIICRANVNKMVQIPRPNHWPRSQILEWLTTNPISDTCDVQFLVNELNRVHDVLLEAAEHDKESASANNGSSAGKQWRGNVPYLRLIMCLTQDTIRSLYLKRAKAKTRQELDARNSDIR
jgi:hypothetical protein